MQKIKFFPITIFILWGQFKFSLLSINCRDVPSVADRICLCFQFDLSLLFTLYRVNTQLRGGATSLPSTTSGVQVCTVRIWCHSQPCYNFWTIILSSEVCPRMALEWPVRNLHLVVRTCRLSWHFNMGAFPDLHGKECCWFPLPYSLGLKTSDLAKTGRETSAQERSLLIVPFNCASYIASQIFCKVPQGK